MSLGSIPSLPLGLFLLLFSNYDGGINDKEYRDNTPDNTLQSETSRDIDSYTATKTDTSLPVTTAKKAPSSSSQPTKLVDLGAAATFASQAAAAAQAENQRKEMTNSTIDSVFGDFSSQPAPQPSTQGTTSGGTFYTYNMYILSV